MKKTVLISLLFAALTLSACGSKAVDQAALDAASQTATVIQEFPETPAPAAAPALQDGERFESVILLEGMEETVRYEHAVNESLGFEIDYEYESLQRQSGAESERFISLWDSAEQPENYLELRRDALDAEQAAAAINEALSETYKTGMEAFSLERAGSCIRIVAHEEKGGGVMAPQLQEVFVIPAREGCLVATSHCSIEAAEGFGRRFGYMLQTLSLAAN